MKSKIVDLYMVASCVVDLQYHNHGFMVGKNDTVVDIGAHIGAFSIFAASKTNHGKVLSFEPDPGNFAQLCENTSLNLLGNIRVVQKAIDEKSGKVIFYRDSLNSAMNSTTKKTNESITVDCISLSDALNTYGVDVCDLLKIDCEGAEYGIIMNASGDILNRVKRLVIEYHTPNYFQVKDKRYTPNNLIEHLKNCGFSVVAKKENAMQGLIWAQQQC